MLGSSLLPSNAVLGHLLLLVILLDNGACPVKRTLSSI
jgi:hypothetical protein